MKRLIQTFCLLFWPSKFIDSAVEDDSESLWKGNKEQARELTAARTKKIRKAKITSFFMVISSCLLGFLTAEYINNNFIITLFHLRIFRVVSISIVAWAVLSRLGDEIASISGNTTTELINVFMFKSFYTIGLYLAVTALFIEANG